MNSRLRNLLASVAALAALGYLVAMVVSGALPENRQLIEFKAEGVLMQAPELITRVAVSSKDASVAFERGPNGWTVAPGHGKVTEQTAKALEVALKIMHNSKPVRVLSREDVADAGPDEFGLAQPRLTVTLGNAAGVALQVEFGASNTDGLLQYMRIRGEDRLYMMSDFVGQSWEKIIARGAAS